MAGKTGKPRQMLDRSKVGVRMKRDSKMAVDQGRRGMMSAPRSTKVNPAIAAVKGTARIAAVKNALAAKRAVNKTAVMASRAPKVMAAAPKKVTGGIKPTLKQQGAPAYSGPMSNKAYTKATAPTGVKNPDKPMPIAKGMESFK